MSSFSQKIPNFLQGISQQPDSKKRPGEVVNAENVYPEFALGLLKRPGGQLIQELLNVDTTDSKWFSIVRDNNEHYVIQMFKDSNNIADFKIWRMKDGLQMFYDRTPSLGLDRTDNLYHTTEFAVSSYDQDLPAAQDADERRLKHIKLQVNSSDPESWQTVTTTVEETTHNAEVDVAWDATKFTADHLETLKTTLSDHFNIDLTWTTKPNVANIDGGHEYGEAEHGYSLKLTNKGAADYTFDGTFADPIEYTHTVTDLLPEATGTSYRIEVAWQNASGTTAATETQTYPITRHGSSTVPLNKAVRDYIVKTDGPFKLYADELSEATGNNQKLIEDYVYDSQAYAVDKNARTDTTIPLFDLETTYDYGNIFTSVRNGVLVSSGGTKTFRYNGATATVDSDGNELDSSGNETGYKFAVGTDRSGENPQLDNLEGVTVHEILVTTKATTGGTAVSEPTWSDNLKGHRYLDTTSTTDAYTYKTAVANLRAIEVANHSTYSSTTTSTYLTADNLDNIEFLTDNDVTYILNKEKIVDWKKDANGDPIKTPAKDDSVLLVLRTYLSSANYRVKVTFDDGTVFETADIPGAPALDSTTAGSLGLYQRISNAIQHVTGTVDSYLNITRFENTYLLQSRGDKKIANVEAYAKEGQNFFDAIPGETSIVGNLPVSAFHGYKVKIVNTEDIDVDDMWVEFKTEYDNPQHLVGGKGTWIESNAPELEYQLDPATLPHKLVRNANGYFELQEIPWEDRRVGDAITNPTPSFVGRNVNGMFFYRNRFGLLSGSSASLSRANSLYDFFNKSALAVGDDDPIDISAVSTRPVLLSYVALASVGLILFGTTEQFLLTTDSDILSPKTAKVNTLSRYDIVPGLEAQSMGTSTAFFSQTGNYLKSVELANVSTTGAASTFEHTQNVPELLPSSINLVTSSPAKSIISFGQKNSNTIHQYRYYRAGDQVLAAAWYKWKLTGKVLFHYFASTSLYAVVQDDSSNYYVVQFDLNQASSSGYLSAGDDLRFDPCLDMWSLNPPVEYTNDNSKIYLPFKDNFNSKLYLILLDEAGTEALPGESTEIISTLSTTTDSVTGHTIITVDDVDLRGRNIIVGYNYDMLVELPTTYPTQANGENISSDAISNLTLHRMKFQLGPSGPVDYQVDIEGIPTWNNTITHAPSHRYKADGLNVSTGDLHTIPIYQRNKNVTVKVIGNTPYPVTLLSMTWEGRLTSKFYRRG